LRTEVERPGFFAALAKQQSPEYLWIGCAEQPRSGQRDHRPAAGRACSSTASRHVVAHADLNCLTVLQFAVDILQVKHIIVVGHYGCKRRACRAGRSASAWPTTGCSTCATSPRSSPRVVVNRHDEARDDRLCELNA